MQLKSAFEVEETVNLINIADSTDIIFVADMFREQYAGGAELTTDSLIKSSPISVQKILCKDVSLELLKQGSSKYWVFGNFASLNSEFIPSIIANLNYSVLEYDYKYCRYRSTEKHLFAEKKNCDCENTQHGKLVSAFYFGAKSLWWMSESQLDHYLKIFPFISDKNNSVLSSVFDDDFFVSVKQLREKYKNADRSGWIVLGSNSWIKGASEAENWCKENSKQYETVWGLPYAEVLEKLAKAKGFVYLPSGKDTCPRMVIEAKLLGCKLHLNDDVQHKNEEWFSTDNLLEIEEYLYGARDLFWKQTLSDMSYNIEISGYTTTRNCIEQQYPWKKSISSMLNFCTEVVVVDGQSTDGTWEELLEWAQSEPRLKISQTKRDWTHKRFAIFDGAQKAEARKLCTKEFCWQMDADEIVPENSEEKITRLCRDWPKLAELISLPVVEFWGSEEKVRVDVNPWKWRLSKNLPHITHGIPTQLRRYDEAGDLYSAPGSDGCDYVHAESGELIPHVTFYNEQAHAARIHALNGNVEALKAYEAWLQSCADILPGVKHYSWIDIERKIKTYKNYWSSHWQSMYNITQEDTAENNMFFDKKWEDVTDIEIAELATRLAESTGGHIFHSKVNLAKPTPSVKIKC